MSTSDREGQLDRIFRALADRTRRAILTRIAEKECRVTELAEPFDMSLNAVSKHLKVLEKAGLLTRTRDGRVHRCRMNGEPLAEVQRVVAFYQSFWERQFDHIARSLDEMALSAEADTQTESHAWGNTDD